MRILVTARLKAKSGNNSTAFRIGDHLLSGGHEVELKCVSLFKSSSDFNDYVVINKLNAIIGIHAFRAGQLLQDCDIPYVIIFGGTDLNEHCKEEEKLEVMTIAVKKAIKCIAFNEALKIKALSLWADVGLKIIVQAQAVEIFNQNYEHKAFEEILRSNLATDMVLSSNAIIFLLVAGLRPVKDPLYLAKIFSEWHKSDNRIYLVIVGPEINMDYSLNFKKAVESSLGIVFIDGLSPTDLQRAMMKVFALVNTSLSEGMASSILEAMTLGLPVIARRNDGNSAIISHRKTGLLFDSPKEFKNLSEELLSHSKLRRDLTENAKKYVLDKHSMERERTVYCQLIESIASRS